MILEGLFTAIFKVADFLLSLLPEINWNFDFSAWSAVTDILNMIAYLLPMGHIKAIIALLLSIGMFRISVSFIRMLLGLIPFFG